MLRRIGSVPEADWRRTFNLGVGMIFVVPARKADRALRLLSRGSRKVVLDKSGPNKVSSDKAWVIGHVAKQRRGKPRVEYS